MLNGLQCFSVTFLHGILESTQNISLCELSKWVVQTNFGIQIYALKYLYLQLMDTNKSQQMNFHSFVLLFGLMSKATLQERLKLLYILHLTRFLDQSNTTACPAKSSCDKSSKILKMLSKICCVNVQVANSFSRFHSWEELCPGNECSPISSLYPCACAYLEVVCVLPTVGIAKPKPAYRIAFSTVFVCLLTNIINTFISSVTHSIHFNN